MILSEVPDFTLGSPAQLVLGWPEEDGGPAVVEARALCLLKRQGGLLLAVPANFFDEELLASAQSAPASDPLGPSELFECTAAILAEGRLIGHGMVMTVLVIDCSEAVCANLRLADSLVDGAEPFVPEDPSLLPYAPGLLTQVNAWIRASDRLEFYSLDEADPGRATPKAKAPAGKAKAKEKQTVTQRRMSAAMLADLNTRLDELADRQSRLEEAGRASSSTKQPLHLQIGSHPPTGKSVQPQVAASLVGPPPKARAGTAALLASREAMPAEMEEAQELLGCGEDSSMLQALLTQSSAITTLTTWSTTWYRAVVAILCSTSPCQVPQQDRVAL